MKKIGVIGICFVIILQSLTAWAYSDSDYAGKLDELQQLLAQCQEESIAVDVEKVAYQTLFQFQDYIKSDIENGVASSQLAYNEDYLERLYQETKASLTGYLEGTIKPRPAIARNTAARRGISGKNFVDAHGNPIISTGYGHFASVVNDVDKLQNLGTDHIAIEMGPANLTKSTPLCHWKLNPGNYGSFTRVSDGLEANALQVVNSANGECSLEQVVPVQPSTAYTITLSAKADTSTVFWIGDSSNRYIVKTTWDTYTYSITTDSNDSFYRLKIGTSSKTTGLYFDRCSMVPQGFGENEVLNGEFERGQGYYFNNEYSYITDALTAAEANDVAVNLLITANSGYMPPFILNLYSDALNIKTGYYNTFGYLVDYPDMLRYLTEFYAFAAHMVKDYPALASIIVANEPRYETLCAPDFYNPKFRNYLARIYKHDIGALNANYHTSYTTFEDVSMPANMEYTPFGYDWMCFNEDVVQAFFTAVYNAVKSRTEIPLSIKIENPMIFQSNATSLKYLRYGIDIEKLSQAFDIAGCDNYCVYNWKETRSDTMAWYDMLSSLTQKPIYNSEDHVIPDADTYFGKEQAEYVRYNLWQGAVHGKTMSSLWSYYRTYDNTRVLYNALLHRPDCIYEAGKTATQLREHTGVLTEFVNRTPAIAMFYSKASRVHAQSYTSAFYQAYKSAVATGQKVGFVTEEHIEKLEDYRVLIVPAAQYTTKEAVGGVKSFLDRGGVVIFVGNDCLKYDPYKNLQDSALTESVNGRVISATTTNLLTKLNDIFSDKIRITAFDGSLIPNLDWQYVWYKKNLYLNVCNIGNADVDFMIICNGKQMEQVKHLFTGTVEGVITAKVNEPLLLSIDLGQTGFPSFSLLSLEEGAGYSATIRNDFESNKKVVVLFLLRDTEGHLKSIVTNTGVFRPDQVKVITAGFSSLSEGDSLSVEIWDRFGEPILASDVYRIQRE